MLDAIRKRTGSIVVKLLLGLLVLSFGAWGIGDYIRGDIGSVAAATVGDREVSAQAASRELQREINRLSQYLGDQATLETARSFGLDTKVIRRLVRDQLYSLAAQSHGIVVSDDDVRIRIHAMPAFKGVTGSFDRATFRQVISNAGYSENGFVELIREEIKQSFVLDSLDSGAHAPTAMIEQIYAYRNETRTARFITVPDSGFTDVVIPDKAAISGYHQDNQDRFMTPEYRDLTFIHLTARDLAADIEVSNEELEEAYTAREDEFVTRASRNVEQAIFTSEEQALKALGMISGGRTFADVVQVLTGATADTLALGWITPDQLMDSDSTDAVFATAPGNLAGPVKSILGWRLFNVIDGKDESRKSLADVADTLRLDVAMERALDDLFELANQLEDQLASGSTLEEAGGRLNVPVSTLSAIDRTGSDQSGNARDDLPGQEFLLSAFSTEEGTESPLVESGSDAYFIVRVNGITGPALRPLEMVRDDVIAAIMADERSRLGKSTADAIVGKLNANADLFTLSAGFGDNPVSGEEFMRDGSGMPDGIPSQMAAKLFAVNIGDGAVVRRTDGYIIGHLTGISVAPPDQSGDDFTALKAELDQGIRSDILDQLSVALELRYPVSINPNALNQSQGAF